MTTIGIAVPRVEGWYFDTVRAGAESVAREAGIDVQVLVEPLGKIGHSVIAERWDSALADPGFLGAVSINFEFKGEERGRLLAHGKPVVAIGGRCAGMPSVFIDDAAVARRSTEHLITLGHRRIAHLAGYALSPDDFTMRSDRVRGYSDAMRTAGLETNAHVLPCDFDHESAYRAALGLLRGPDRPTAVFAAADVLALPVLEAARDLGIEVPRQLSVIAIDDTPEAAPAGLTSFKQDPYGQGAAATRRVLDSSISNQQEFKVELVIRTSTAAPGHYAAPRLQRLKAIFRPRPPA